MYAKNEKIYLVHVSKHSSNHEKQVNLLMIPNKERYHYTAVKKLPTLLSGITSKQNDGFYFLNCLHSFAIKSNLESHQKMSGSKDFLNIVMPSEDTEILEFNQYQKSNQAIFIIYADLECLTEKIDGCKNNPETHLKQK